MSNKIGGIADWSNFMIPNIGGIRRDSRCRAPLNCHHGIALCRDEWEKQKR